MKYDNYDHSKSTVEKELRDLTSALYEKAKQAGVNLICLMELSRDEDEEQTEYAIAQTICIEHEPSVHFKFIISALQFDHPAEFIREAIPSVLKDMTDEVIGNAKRH